MICMPIKKKGNLVFNSNHIFCTFSSSSVTFIHDKQKSLVIHIYITKHFKVGDKKSNVLPIINVTYRQFNYQFWVFICLHHFLFGLFH